MVQNQMTPSYPAFSQTPGIEEFQQQTGAIPTQAPTPTAAAVAADPQAQFKAATDQTQSAAVTTVTNGVEQQTVSVLWMYIAVLCVGTVHLSGKIFSVDLSKKNTHNLLHFLDDLIISQTKCPAVLLKDGMVVFQLVQFK